MALDCASPSCQSRASKGSCQIVNLFLPLTDNKYLESNVHHPSRHDGVPGREALLTHGSGSRIRPARNKQPGRSSHFSRAAAPRCGCLDVLISALSQSKDASSHLPESITVSIIVLIITSHLSGMFSGWRTGPVEGLFHLERHSGPVIQSARATQARFTRLRSWRPLSPPQTQTCSQLPRNTVGSSMTHFLSPHQLHGARPALVSAQQSTAATCILQEGIMPDRAFLPHVVLQRRAGTGPTSQFEPTCSSHCTHVLNLQRWKRMSRYHHPGTLEVWLIGNTWDGCVAR